MNLYGTTSDWSGSGGLDLDEIPSPVRFSLHDGSIVIDESFHQLESNHIETSFR